MKLAHLADLHLGFRQYYRQTSNGINQREADVGLAFQRVIDDIVEAGPDIIVIAGDLFHSVRPTNPAILHAFNQFRRLRETLSQTPIVIVAGDHDTPRSIETGTILKLFEVLDNVFVISQEARELVFERLDLSVVGVPYAALLGGRTQIPMPESTASRKVLVTHGEVAGVLPPERSGADRGAVVMEPSALHAERWTYVALGHYHVAHSVARNAWYSGALDYVSRNPWGELRDEAREGRKGKKGWLLVTLGEEVKVEFKPAQLERRVIDLEAIQGEGLSAADLDRLIAERVSSIKSGIDHQVVRQVVFDVPRPIARELDHQQIRDLKARALNYHLDVRRPPTASVIGTGTAGPRQTLREVVSDYLTRRPLTSDVAVEDLVALGNKYLDEVDRDSLEE